MLSERVKTWTEEWKQRVIQEGMQQGRQQGLQQCLQQGVHLGEIKVLRRRLARRFSPLPPWVDQRLEQATEADLERWTDRVLDCENLEDIFDDTPRRQD